MAGLAPGKGAVSTGGSSETGQKRAFPRGKEGFLLDFSKKSGIFSEYGANLLFP